MAVLGHSQAETMALRPQHGCCKVKVPLTLVAAPQFLTVPFRFRSACSHGLRNTGSNRGSMFQQLKVAKCSAAADINY